MPHYSFNESKEGRRINYEGSGIVDPAVLKKMGVGGGGSGSGSSSSSCSSGSISSNGSHM